ncbi:hypothetical protein ACFFLM_04420 [Deinococcus oregonensis]|uniref:Uncharacterized protein n=1 Tax=Deinococcus oregonensis TaxID=1805970 RepID=A0ABV6AUP5_9DEIO
MAIDARPFLQLTTPGGSIRCARPALNPLALGVSGRPGGVATDNATHTIVVYVALGTPPADLVDNAVVSVNVDVGKPEQTFRVLRNGIQQDAGTWTLYVRQETSMAGYEP